MSKPTITKNGSNAAIRNAIQKIALHGIYNPRTETLNDVGSIIGYVVAVNTEGELAGTIDVQEYNNSISDGSTESYGYHKGVYLSAIQKNDKGLVIIPKMYSDVVVTRDPITNKEFVTMMSHVDIIQLDSHDSIIIEVKERNEFNINDEDAPDVDELEETGIYTKTQYSKNAIVTDVQGENEEDKIHHELNEKEAKIIIGDDKTVQTINQEKFHIQHDKAEIIVNDDGVESKMGNSSVKVKDGTVYLGNDQNVDDSVLGGELADILCDILNCISQMQTTTQLGPQPPLNVASFISLKARITAFKNAHSGFLTSKVKVQK